LVIAVSTEDQACISQAWIAVYAYIARSERDKLKANACWQRDGGDARGTLSSSAAASDTRETGPKRLHVSNIPFRFRETDLRNLLAVCTDYSTRAVLISESSAEHRAQNNRKRLRGTARRYTCQLKILSS